MCARNKRYKIILVQLQLEFFKAVFSRKSVWSMNILILIFEADFDSRSIEQQNVYFLLHLLYFYCIQGVDKRV